MLNIKSIEFGPLQIKKIYNIVIQNEISKRISTSSFWSLTGAVISRILMLISTIFIARIIGQIQFGEMNILQSTVTMLISFANFGLGMTATKYVAEYRTNNPEKIGAILASSRLVTIILGIFFTLILIVFAPIIAINLLYAPHLINELRLSSIILFFSTLNGFQAGSLSGFEDFKLIAKINFLFGIIYLPIIISSTYFWGLFGTILGLSVNSIIEWLLNYYFLRNKLNFNKIKLKVKYKLSNFKYLWTFSLPALLGGLLVGPVIWYTNTLIIKSYDGYKEFALLSVGRQWYNFILFVPLALSQIILPILSNLKSNPISFIKAIKYNIYINLIITLILSLITILLSDLILGLYGDSYKSGYWIVIILAFTACIFSINNIIGYALASLNKMWKGFVANLVWALSLILLSNLFLNIYSGALGISLALLSSYLIHFIILRLLLTTAIQSIDKNNL